MDIAHLGQQSAYRRYLQIKDLIKLRFNCSNSTNSGKKYISKWLPPLEGIP